jgi:hypothetical protein
VWLGSKVEEEVVVAERMTDLEKILGRLDLLGDVLVQERVLSVLNVGGILEQVHHEKVFGGIDASTVKEGEELHETAYKLEIDVVSKKEQEVRQALDMRWMNVCLAVE